MKKNRVFILAGKARSGKDTIAGVIQKYYQNKNKIVARFGYADYIKDYAKHVSDWDGSDENKPRTLLQTIGTDIVRKQINKNFFINRVCEDIRVYKYLADVIIISGARFPNELDIPKQKFNDIIIIKVDRPNYENNLTKKQKKHISENALGEYNNYDYLIKNDGSIENLEKKTIEIIKEVEHEH